MASQIDRDVGFAISPRKRSTLTFKKYICVIFQFFLTNSGFRDLGPLLSSFDYSQSKASAKRKELSDLRFREMTQSIIGKSWEFERAYLHKKFSTLKMIF